ncbi:MAG: hypothetical protein LBH46_04320 [Rickettsiales bacterium]|jgi:hypothetical protein|nr:hypothetical protein [Rickettsiales bacterium]
MSYNTLHKYDDWKYIISNSEINAFKNFKYSVEANILLKEYERLSYKNKYNSITLAELKKKFNFTFYKIRLINKFLEDNNIIVIRRQWFKRVKNFTMALYGANVYHTIGNSTLASFSMAEWEDMSRKNFFKKIRAFGVNELYEKFKFKKIRSLFAFFCWLEKCFLEKDSSEIEKTLQKIKVITDPNEDMSKDISVILSTLAQKLKFKT